AAEGGGGGQQRGRVRCELQPKPLPARDARRDAWLAGRGIRVLRIAAADVLDETSREGIVRLIADEDRKRPPPLRYARHRPRGGGRCGRRRRRPSVTPSPHHPTCLARAA